MLHYWFLLPVGIAVSTTVMSAGVSGATLWVPVYLLWLGLDTQLAFWLGLFTMLFGFGSGVYRNWRDGSYDGALVRRALMASVPVALAAGWCAALINERVLVGAFGTFLFIYAGLIAYRTLRPGADADRRRRRPPYLRLVIGGTLTGLISIGVGVLAMPAVLRHRSIRTPATAIGSLVMIIFFTSMAAVLGRLRPAFVAQLSRELPQLVRILVWVLPGAVTGGQLGPRLARLLPSERHALLYFSTVLIGVGALTLARAFG